MSKPTETKRYPGYEEAKSELSIGAGVDAVKKLVELVQATLGRGTQMKDPVVDTDHGDKIVRMIFTPEEYCDFALKACDEFKGIVLQIEAAHKKARAKKKKPKKGRRSGDDFPPLAE